MGLSIRLYREALVGDIGTELEDIEIDNAYPFGGREEPLNCGNTKAVFICRESFGYSSYYHFRAELIRVFYGGISWEEFHQRDEIQGGPFFDLIWFSDCEGCIGPDACKRIDDDFREYSSKTRGIDDFDNRFMPMFHRLKNLFEKAIIHDGFLIYC